MRRSPCLTPHVHAILLSAESPSPFFPLRLALDVDRKEAREDGCGQAVKENLDTLAEAYIGLSGWLPLCLAELFCSNLTAHAVGVYHFMEI